MNATIAKIRARHMKRINARNRTELLETAMLVSIMMFIGFGAVFVAACHIGVI